MVLKRSLVSGIQPIRILIVEDFHAETEALLLEIRDAEMVYELAIARDEKTYKEELEVFKPDVILSPYSLKGTNAIKLLGLARKSNVEAPFILLAFDLSEDIAIDLLGEGIEDYVQQSTLKRLPVAIKRALQRYKTQLELQISESRLRASEEAMRNMVKNAPIAVAMFDRNMAYLVVSETWLKHEEKTDDIIGKKHYDVVPEIPESWKEVHKKVLTGETHGAEREKMLRADGSVEVLRWKMNPWYNHDGEIGGAVLFIEDISEKEAIRIELEQNEQIQAIGEHLGKSGSFEFVLATGEVRWSKNMYEITGFKASSPVSNEAFLECVHPEDQEAYASAFKKALETKSAFPFEYRFIRPDNDKVIYLSVHSTFTGDDQNNPVSLIGSVRDVTTIRLAQQNVVKSQQLLAIGEELGGSGSFEFDIATQTPRWSENMYKIKGIDPSADISHEAYIKHVHPEDRDSYIEGYSNIMLSIEPSQFEYRLIRPDNGKVVRLRVHSTFIKNKNGAPVSLMGSVQDVTEIRLAQADLQESEASLKAAQETAKIGSWVLNSETQKVEWSDQMFAIHEIKKQPVEVGLIRGMIHPEELTLFDSSFEQLVGGQDTDMIYRIILPKTEMVKYLHAMGRVEKNDDGSINKISGTVQDITEQHLTAIELEKSEASLKAAQQIAKVGSWEWAKDEKYVSMSDEMFTIYETRKKKLTIKDIRSFIHPEDAERVADLAAADLTDSLTPVINYRIITGKGNEKHVISTAKQVFDSKGEVERLVGTLQDVTDSVQIEQVLSEKESLLREMAENITEVFWLTDWINNQVLYVSPRYETLYGLTVQSLYDDPGSWAQRVHPEDLPRINKLFSETAGLGTYDEELRLLMEDGTIKWVRDRAFPIKDENGTVVRLAGITEEITESRLMQSELKEQEELLRQMAENISGVFYLSDWVNDKVLYTSSQFETLYGLPLDTLYENRSSWHQAVHPDDLKDLLKTFKKEAPLGTFDYEFRLLMKDGSIKWVRDRAFPIKDQKGKVVRMAGITEDITRQKEAEERIETLSLVASETVNGVLIQDPTGKIEWSNKGFTKISGYEPEEILGKRPWSFLSGEKTNTKLTELTFKKVKEGKSFTTENTLYSKNGMPIWISLAVTPIFDSSGRLNRMVSIGTDISKQKELEELQKSMLTRMEARVVERTSELESTNQELRKEIWENQRISDELYHHNLDLKDSIAYAKRIQESILPDEKSIQKSFPHGFVLFLPRDVVSGDFYWYYKRNNLSYFAAIDCTGHGVPGALMSMIANELMNQAVIQKKLTDPSEILTLLNKLMVRTLRQKNVNNMRDGMDLSLIVVDHDSDTLQFSGAFSSMYIFQNDEMSLYPGNRHSIGGHLEDVKKAFGTTKVSLSKGASIYLTTDGYIDQFGGPDGKKLMKKRFEEFLSGMQSLPMDEQKEALLNKFNEWKGPLNQVDDVLVAGLSY